MEDSMKDLLISIIIPIYNVEKYLSRCLDSVINQTYKHLEIILIDDGSTDGSPLICDNYQKKDKRIQVYHKTNGGLSSARNLGLNYCSGKYIAFIDSDDWVEFDFYKILIQLCEQYQVKMACCGRYDIDSKTGMRKIGLCPQVQEVITSIEILHRVLTWSHMDMSVCDKLFHKDLWVDNRFPIGKKSEDVAVMYKIISSIDAIVLYDRPLYNYYHRENSITTSKVSEHSFDIMYHADEITSYISRNYPSLINDAKYFQILTYAHILMEVYKQESVETSIWVSSYQKLFEKFIKEKSNWQHKAIFNFREKLLLSIVQYPYLYRLVRGIRNILK